MAAHLAGLCFDANEPDRLARFWAGVLGQEPPFELRFRQVAESKTAKNPIHLDLVAESVGHQGELVDRFLGLGARRVDIGQGADAGHVVLGDPEGNEFDIVVRGEFLADTGFVGAVVFEPANPVTGYFWGKAIGWPVVYDQDGDVAVRAPDGRGPFLTFGPPGTVEPGTSRLHLDLVMDDETTDVERLLALGARPVDRGGAIEVLADPDGNEFFVR